MGKKVGEREGELLSELAVHIVYIFTSSSFSKPLLEREEKRKEKGESIGERKKKKRRGGVRCVCIESFPRFEI